jgi:UDP-glucose 4-epimerase
MKKKYLVITGGAGFVGSNLIKKLLKDTNYKLISIDNYSTGKIKNQINNPRVEYIKSHTKNISSTLNGKKKQIKSIFHFGEFSRIYQSFLNMNDCISSNSIGTFEVFNFCLRNKIKLVYSATSATLGNYGKDKTLSPYAFTKAKNIELLDNLKNWFKFKYEVLYFYNVYGPGHISSGNMATVIGIFEKSFRNNIPLPVVKPGTQSRQFTHIDDTIEVCFEAWKKDKCKHYSIFNKKSYTIIEVAKLFSKKINYLPPRKGERFASALTKIESSDTLIKRYGKKSLKEYVKNFKISLKKQPII